MVLRRSRSRVAIRGGRVCSCRARNRARCVLAVHAVLAVDVVITIIAHSVRARFFRVFLDASPSAGKGPDAIEVIAIHILISIIADSIGARFFRVFGFRWLG